MTTSTRELKSILHESIENIDDEETLGIVKEILEHKYSPAPLRLSAGQINALDIAEQQIARGEYMTDEEANARSEKWLNE